MWSEGRKLERSWSFRIYAEDVEEAREIVESEMPELNPRLFDPEEGELDEQQLCRVTASLSVPEHAPDPESQAIQDFEEAFMSALSPLSPSDLRLEPVGAAFSAAASSSSSPLVSGSPFTAPELSLYASSILDANQLTEGDTMVFDLAQAPAQRALVSRLRAQAYSRGVQVISARFDAPGRAEALREGIEKNALFLNVNSAATPAPQPHPDNLEADSCSGYVDLWSSNSLRWGFVMWPTPQWAERVYPDLPSDQAYRRLGLDLFDICHAGSPGGFAAHLESLKSIRDRLNLCDLAAVELSAPSVSGSGPGTRLAMRLSPGQRFEVAGWDVGGRWMQANIPSEEVWGTPDPDSVEGVFECSRPLIYEGHLFDGVSGRIEAGRLVDIQCREGDAQLLHKCFVEMPQRARAGDRQWAEYLNFDAVGELGLVSASSPVARSGRVFYETIVDENSGCHVGLGSSYGEINIGPHHQANRSSQHCDFTIGTPRMQVTGFSASGARVEVMRDGEWAEVS